MLTVSITSGVTMIPRSQRSSLPVTALILVLVHCQAIQAEILGVVWTPEQTQAILEKTISIHLEPDLSHLTAGERKALGYLLQAGNILHDLYLQQLHPQALAARAELEGGNAPDKQEMLRLFWLFKGPIATTLANQRVPFLPVAAETRGKAVYPLEITKEELDAYLAGHPQQRAAVLDPRSVVRRATTENIDRNRATLGRYPVLATLHAELERRLRSMTSAEGEFFAVPYAVEYADQILPLFELLNRAASAVDVDDPEFAGYLRNRARDLLTNDYESGDASWVTGRFRNLNAQIGSYETYDDALYGVKAFYSMSVLARDPASSQSLATALEGIQSIEDALPYEPHKRVRQDIPVHVCNVIADFGQARGTNTATILPNDAVHSRKYGRTILLRTNIMKHPALFEIASQQFRLAVAAPFRNDFTLSSTFQRTLWHEVGHYLGVDRTEDGRDLSSALQESSDLFEEMKADLVSLFAAKLLHDAGVHDDAALRSVYAAGILRVLQLSKPRRDQPYQTMQLIQWNYFLENGLLDYDSAKGELAIRYDHYHRVVIDLLREVLAIQRGGDPRAANAFIERYTVWRNDLHEVIAGKLRDAAAYRYRYVQYAALLEHDSAK